MGGRKIQTTSAIKPRPLLLRTRSYGLRTLSIVSTFFCKKVLISDSILRTPPVAPSCTDARRDEMVGISMPVLAAFHVRSDAADALVGCGERRETLLLASASARTDGSTSRSGMEGCRIVRCAVKRRSTRRSTALEGGQVQEVRANKFARADHQHADEHRAIVLFTLGSNSLQTLQPDDDPPPPLLPFVLLPGHLAHELDVAQDGQKPRDGLVQSTLSDPPFRVSRMSRHR